MNILDAFSDPELFGPFFTPAGSYKAWNAFNAALFGLPQPEGGLPIFQACTGRQTAPTTPFREAWLICGRRGGKSRNLGTIAVYLAAFRNYTPHLAPGERATIAVIAADRRQARSIFRFVSGLIRAVPMLAAMVDREDTETIDLNNRVTIEITTASFRATRGYSYAAVLGDEAAFWRDADTSANPAEEILAAVRPGLSSIPGSMLLMASSPYAKRGPLYQAFRRHFGRDDSRLLVWKASSQTMNPTLPAEVVEQALEDDPARAAAEYMAEFRDDIAAFVTREVIDACTVPERRELPPLPGITYRAFTDPSGGSSDSMTLAIAHDADGIAVLDAVREFRPPFSPESVVMECAGLLKSYRLSEVTGDRYAGEWPRERFAVHGITYQLSEKSKSDLYRDTLPLFNGNRAELLDLPRLQSQLIGLERRTARGGRDTVDHSPGAHDDIANAVAGALLLAGKPEVTPQPMQAVCIPWMMM